jgi:hypothetical protein
MSTNRTHNTRRWRRQGDSFVVRETWLHRGKPVTGFMMVGNGWALRHTPKQAPEGWYEPDEEGGLDWVDAPKGG